MFLVHIVYILSGLTLTQSIEYTYNRKTRHIGYMLVL